MGRVGLVPLLPVTALGVERTGSAKEQRVLGGAGAPWAVSGRAAGRWRRPLLLACPTQDET